MPENSNDNSYKEYFALFSTAWEYDLSNSSDTMRLIPINNDFSRQTLLSVESIVINLNTPPGFYMHRKNYDSFQVCYSLSGRGRLIYDQQEYDLFPGDVFFIDCNKEHYFYTVGEHDWIHHGMQIQGHQLPSIFQQFYQNHSVKTKLADNNRMQTLFLELAHNCESGTNTAMLMRNLLLWDIFTLLLSCAQTTTHQQLPAKIARACAYLEENFTKISSIDQIADACYISKYYLCREFKKCLGQTLNDYLTNLKINRAKLYLSTTDKSIEEIAYEVGFSTNHFFNIFKKKEGLTPHKYRKNNPLTY